jgi:hypothetical protein
MSCQGAKPLGFVSLCHFAALRENSSVGDLPEVNSITAWDRFSIRAESISHLGKRPWG